GEELGDVADFRGELLRARSPFLVLREDPPVLFERRAAAGGVDEDRVENAALALRLFEARDRALREFARFAFAAGVDGEGAAATLVRRHRDVEALGGEHAERRLVDAGEEDALDAAGEERDPAAPRGPRGDELGQAAADLVKRDGRKELFHRGEAA